jgi:hypothetical protein
VGSIGGFYQRPTSLLASRQISRLLASGLPIQRSSLASVMSPASQQCRSIFTSRLATFRYRQPCCAGHGSSCDDAIESCLLTLETDNHRCTAITSLAATFIMRVSNPQPWLSPRRTTAGYRSTLTAGIVLRHISVTHAPISGVPVQVIAHMSGSCCTLLSHHFYTIFGLLARHSPESRPSRCISVWQFYRCFVSTTCNVLRI